MDGVTSDLTGLLYQTELIIVPFTNPLIRLESLVLVPQLCLVNKPADRVAL